jgi:hypothetical protein
MTKIKAKLGCNLFEVPKRKLLAETENKNKSIKAANTKKY